MSPRAATVGFLFAAILGFPVSGYAGMIVGGSSLLTSPDLDQLETWLGEGELTITKIFSATDGDGKTATDFHAAVDNQGRTFAVLELKENTVINRETGSFGNPRQIIGGYNPVSWDSDFGGHYHQNVSNIGRTAFLFNLTTDVKQDQKQVPVFGSDYGQYQTYNWAGGGPTFGGGFDLHVRFDLSSGYTQNYSYGTGNAFTDDILADDGYLHEGTQMFGTIEVFTIAQQQVSAVPESGSLIAWSLGAIVSGGACFRRRRNRA
jgi:hypothetical protein